MKFGSIKIGKSKEKEDSKGAAEEEPAVIDALLNDPEILEDAPVRPHGPIGELALEPEETSAETDLNTDADPDSIPEEGAESVKLVEVTPEPAPELPVEKKVGENADMSDSLSNLFKNDDEEENPLANLIKSLPDVAASELISDLNEIKDIIKDWQRK